jgi:hypothetical protein
LKFEFESNFNAARYCKPQAHLSEPHASPTTAHLHRPRALPAAAPALLLCVARPRRPPLPLSFSLCASTATPPHASFAFPSIVRHRPKRITLPPAPRRGVTIRIRHRGRWIWSRPHRRLPLSVSAITGHLPLHFLRISPYSCLHGVTGVSSGHRRPPLIAAFRHPIDEPSLR